MRKKHIKIVISILIIFSVFYNSIFAATEADNAFVTKEEFDATLNRFNDRLVRFESGINSKIDSQVTSYLDRNGIWNGLSQDILNMNDVTQTGTVLKKYNSLEYSTISSYSSMFGSEVYDGSRYKAKSHQVFNCTKSGLVFFQVFATDTSNPITNSDYARSVWYSKREDDGAPFSYRAAIDMVFSHIDPTTSVEIDDASVRMTTGNGFYHGADITTAPSSTKSVGYGEWSIFNMPQLQTVVFFVNKGVTYSLNLYFVHHMGNDVIATSDIVNSIKTGRLFYFLSDAKVY